MLFFSSDWGRQDADSTSQPRCPGGWVPHCAWINFCLSARLPLSFFLSILPRFVLSLITCFRKPFFLGALNVTRLLGLRSWDFQVLLFFLFLMGLLEFALLSLTLLSKTEGFSIGQTSNIKWRWWWNMALKDNCSSEALEANLQHLRPHTPPSQQGFRHGSFFSFSWTAPQIWAGSLLGLDEQDGAEG